MQSYMRLLENEHLDSANRSIRNLLLLLACMAALACGQVKPEIALPAVDVEANVAGGTYTSAQSVGFLVTAMKVDSSTEVEPISAVDIYYSTDGSVPSDASNVMKLDVSKIVTSETGRLLSSNDKISILSSQTLRYFAVITVEHSREKKSATGSKAEIANVPVKGEVETVTYVIADAPPTATPTVTPTASPTVTPIAVSANSDNSNGSGVSLTYSVTKPQYLPGTLSFTSNATSILCSNDSGSSYYDCASAGALAVTASGYDLGTQYRVKFTLGASSYEYTWTPKTAAPGLVMANCNVGVVENMTKAAFEALWQSGTDATHRHTVCLADDVVINANPTGNVYISATNIELVGSSTAGHRSSVHRLQIAGTGSANRAYVTGGTYEGGIIAQGSITKVFNGFWARGHDRNGVYIGSGTMSITMSNCDIQMTNANGVTESIYGDNSAPNLNLSIDSCTIKNTGTGSFGNDCMYFRGFGSTIAITNSTIEIANNNYAAAFRLHQTISATISDSIIRADANAYQAININVTNTLSLNRCTIETGQRGIKFATSSNTLNLNRNTFKHTGGTDRHALDLSASSTQTINNTSSGGNNLFCYVAGSATSFLSILSSVQSAGTFNAAGTSNGNNTTINQCP